MWNLGSGLLSAVLALPLLAAAPTRADDGGEGATVASAALLDGAPARGRGLRVHADLRTAGGVHAGSFRLDAGAAESVAPASALEALGVIAEGYATYRHADGREELLPYGLVRIEFLGVEHDGRVVFGAEDVEAVLGRDALQAAGLSLDAETGALTAAE